MTQSSRGDSATSPRMGQKVVATILSPAAGVALKANNPAATAMTIDCELKRKRGINDSTQRTYTLFLTVANNKKPGELKLDRALSE